MNTYNPDSNRKIEELKDEHLEGIRCIVCGNTKKSRFIPKFFRFNCVIVECLDCSFCFIPPFFRKDINYKEYKSIDDVQEISKGDIWLKIERNKLRFQLIRKYVKTGSIYDVGCGFGHFLLTAKQLGYDASGIEMSSANAEYIEKELNIPIQRGDFAELEFSKKYDLITLWDVLEHIDHADRIIKKVSQLLKPGGYVIIQVPQWDSFLAKILGEKWWRMCLDHVNYFSKSTIKQLYSQYDLRVIKLKSSLEFKTLLINFIIPKLKSKKKQSHSLTRVERHKEFNRMTNKPKFIKYMMVKAHNGLYKILSFLRIGDEMVVVGKKE